MDERILARLGVVTNEEAQILSGRTSIDRSIYMNDGSRDVITGKKLLEQGKQITVRPHTRFVHFPEHTHDYVEIVYMCRGKTTHIVNDTRIVLSEGELLLMGQNTRQEILPAGEGDIAVNFIVQPEFFGGTLDFLGSEETPLRDFIVRCLCGDNPSGYLHFKVADVKPVQNLVENLLWTLITDTPNRRSINQLTMGLLFVQLLNHTDKLTVGNKEQDAIVWVLRYIEEHFADGSLTEIADMLHYDVTWLCREIKRRTGKTYTQLLQEKRLSQAAWLLRNTTQKVADIGISVGYENLSYFHRIFAQHFGISPKAYRDCK
jgi:AraC-like DNA-binding protein/quercetin dioxygenase-like cupin family protein